MLDSTFQILDSAKLSILDKMTILNNIKEILQSSSSLDETAQILTSSFEEFFNSKLEEIKENIELRSEGNFSKDYKKQSFKRMT